MTPEPKTRRLGAILAASALLLLTATVHAQPLAEGLQAEALHCTVWLQPIEPGEASSRVLHAECSDAPNPAILGLQSAAITDGIVPPVPLPIGFEVVCDGNSADCTGADTVIGIDYEHSNEDGSSITWVGEVRCDTGVTYGAPAMPAGWNDRVSSAHGYAGCSMRHWEHEAYGGASLQCSPACSSFGVMNDETSSVTFG